MSKAFLEGLEKENNFTTTENGAVAFRTTSSSLLDLFATIGSMRKASDIEIRRKWIKAFDEDNLLAMKLLFYARDIRGGLGERRVSRVIFNYLADTKSTILAKNLENIVEYGRWDDMFQLIGIKPRLDSHIMKIITEQLEIDLKAEYPSLMAKWLPSINTSSKQTRMLAEVIRTSLDMSPKQYRKTLSSLRSKINIVEKLMSQGNWAKIDFSKVPSRAMTVYRNAFWKHEESRMQSFIDSLQKGDKTVKINANTLYPYDLVERLCVNWGGWSHPNFKNDVVINEQWKALPNYVEGTNRAIVMADTSASMNGRPMATALGLAIYFAERNKGVFKNRFITFSSEPRLVILKGDTLYDKLHCVPYIVDSTNLQKAFELLLNTATQNKLSQDDLPEALIVITDMQFDSATDTSRHNTWFEKMEKMFAQAGYNMPNVIFWNVDSRKDTFQAHSQHKGVQMYSGQSASTFKAVISNIGKTPFDGMLDILNGERYNKVTI